MSGPYQRPCVWRKQVDLLGPPRFAGDLVYPGSPRIEQGGAAEVLFYPSPHRKQGFTGDQFYQGPKKNKLDLRTCSAYRAYGPHVDERSLKHVLFIFQLFAGDWSSYVRESRAWYRVPVMTITNHTGTRSNATGSSEYVDWEIIIRLIVRHGSTSR